MKQNYVIFFILSFLIIILSSHFLSQKKGQKSPEQKPVPTASPVWGQPPYSPPTQTGAGFPVPTPQKTQQPAAAAKSRSITLKTPLYTGVIDTLGGTITKWELADYKSTIKPYSPPVDVLHDTPGAYNSRVVIEGMDIPYPIPFTYEGPWEIEIFRGTEIHLLWDSGKGIEIRKTYIIDSGSYLIESRVEVTNKTPNRLRYSLGVVWLAEMAKQKNSEFNRKFIALISGDVERKDKAPKKPEEFRGATTWFGFADKYFIAAYLPEIGAETDLRFDSAGGNKLVRASFSYPPNEIILPGQVSVKSSKLYLGPMDFKYLQSLGKGLENAVQYGWVGFLARPMLSLLKVFHGWFDNYGLAIILITVLIRVLFLPLTIKSMESMKNIQTKMQAIKPKIDAMKEKYKDDKAKQNQELMQIYSSHGINPLSSLGGCMPMLIQIPVFIALYDVLLYSIELRHSPFLWIGDLAEPEYLFDIPGIGIPFRILPLVMGGSWYMSQKLTPTTAPGADNMQMKMMEYMPIIFTVMFWGLPSGLILYWTVSNLLSIVQQLWVNQRIAKKGRA